MGERCDGRLPSPPPFFGTAHSKGFTDVVSVSADSKGVAEGQLRPKPGKTLCLLASAHSKGVMGEVASDEWLVMSDLAVEDTLPSPLHGKECGSD